MRNEENRTICWDFYVRTSKRVFFVSHCYIANQIEIKKRDKTKDEIIKHTRSEKMK